MPLVIEQMFPLGRYHATRWNQNPFEDAFGEWPPSPWRLLRALAARWFQYLRETGDDRPNLRDSLLSKLAADLPSFRLPVETWRGRELRQYQPTALEVQYKYKTNPKTKKKDLEYSFRQVSKTLALDAYRAIPHRQAIYWIWSRLDLSAEETRLLGNLLDRTHYFGRADTWTRMRLIDASDGAPEPNCELNAMLSSGSAPVLVCRPDRPLDIEVLLASTTDKRLSYRRIPDGCAWHYAKLPERNHARPGSSVDRHGTAPRPQIARFALDSAVLPLVSETLPVAESARRMLMGIYGRKFAEADGSKGRSSVFSGKGADGQPLEGHGHAYYLPTQEDRDAGGRLDHLTIVATDGFGRQDLRALDCLRDLKSREREQSGHRLRVLLLGLGRLDDYLPWPVRPSREWVSATPFVAPRHLKRRGTKRDAEQVWSSPAEFLRTVLLEELARLIERRPDLTQFPLDSIKIEPLIDAHGVFRIGPRRLRPIQFKRYRQKRGDDGGNRPAGAFRIIFPEPVKGPISLGHSRHFGLGLFVPSEIKAAAIQPADANAQ
jgi:CRISPR-associated protein Csb2